MTGQQAAPGRKPRVYRFATEAEALAAMRPEALLVVAAGNVPDGLRTAWMTVAGEGEGESSVRLYMVRKEFAGDAKHGEIVRDGGWVLVQSVGEPHDTEYPDQPLINRAIPRTTVRGHAARQWESRFDGEDSCVLMWNESTTTPGRARRFWLISPPGTCGEGGEQLKVANGLVDRS